MVLSVLMIAWKYVIEASYLLMPMAVYYLPQNMLRIFIMKVAQCCLLLVVVLKLKQFLTILLNITYHNYISLVVMVLIELLMLFAWLVRNKV